MFKLKSTLVAGVTAILLAGCSSPGEGEKAYADFMIQGLERDLGKFTDEQKKCMQNAFYDTLSGKDKETLNKYPDFVEAISNPKSEAAKKYEKVPADLTIFISKSEELGEEFGTKIRYTCF